MTRINNDDMKHLESFSEAQKNTVLRKIMSHPPAKTVVMEGNNPFEKTLIRLRRAGSRSCPGGGTPPQDAVAALVARRRCSWPLPVAREWAALPARPARVPGKPAFDCAQARLLHLRCGPSGAGAAQAGLSGRIQPPTPASGEAMGFLGRCRR